MRTPPKFAPNLGSMKLRTPVGRGWPDEALPAISWATPAGTPVGVRGAPVGAAARAISARWTPARTGATAAGAGMRMIWVATRVASRSAGSWGDDTARDAHCRPDAPTT